MTPFADPAALYPAVRQAWSAKTCCARFDPSNPGKNQCSVTALAVQHFFGGDIVKTPTKGGTHFYNLVDGAYWDLSSEQFGEPIPYFNLPSDRAEALGDSSPAKLAALLQGIDERVRHHGGERAVTAP